MCCQSDSESLKVQERTRCLPGRAVRGTPIGAALHLTRQNCGSQTQMLQGRHWQRPLRRSSGPCPSAHPFLQAVGVAQQGESGVVLAAAAGGWLGRLGLVMCSGAVHISGGQEILILLSYAVAARYAMLHMQGHAS